MGYLVGDYGYAAVGWTYATFSSLALLLFIPVAIRVRNSTPEGTIVAPSECVANPCDGPPADRSSA